MTVHIALLTFFKFIDTVVIFFISVFCIIIVVVCRDEDLCDLQITGKRHKLLIGTYRRKDCLVSRTSLRCLAEACFPKASNLDLKRTQKK